MKDYMILKDERSDNLELKVMDALKKGWNLVGGHQSDNSQYSQTMTREIK